MREEILRELTEEVKVIAGEERKVICREVSKNNGVKLQGMTIAAKNEFMAPTIYVDGYVEKISDGEMSIEEAAETIVEIYHQNQGMDLGVDTSVLGSKEFILGKVEYQLVNTENNRERLENVPHKELLDLSAVYRVVVSRDENGSASYMVTNEMIETAGITMQELDEAAMENTNRREFSIHTMQEIMCAMGIPKEMAEMASDGPRMYVLTNSDKFHGANVLLYSEVLSRLADSVGGDFYILPSSIHEVLAVPVDDIDDPAYLKSMVSEVNQTEVSDEEVLGYSIYKYSRKEERLSIAE